MSVATICGWLGLSRQAYYQHQQRQQRQVQQAEAIVAQVRALRHRHPRMGCRKVLHRLRPWLAQHGYQLGRDRLFELLRARDMLIGPKRRRRPRTTWAGHWRCENLLAEATVTGPDQAYVSDITYIETEHGFAYLTLITDAYSRLIVGHAVSDSLASAGSLQALEQALGQRPRGLGPFIHHSDRGVQFTDQRFRERVRQAGGRSSMGAKGDCYDNALAERMNGTVKLEYGLDGCFRDLDQVRRAVAESVWLYNHERPHLALHYRTPAHVHTLC